MFTSDENLKYVESKKAELAAASADEVANAQGKADVLSGAKVEIKVQVTEEGHCTTQLELEKFLMHSRN